MKRCIPQQFMDPERKHDSKKVPLKSNCWKLFFRSPQAGTKHGSQLNGLKRVNFHQRQLYFPSASKRPVHPRVVLSVKDF